MAPFYQFPFDWTWWTITSCQYINVLDTNIYRHPPTRKWEAINWDFFFSQQTIAFVLGPEQRWGKEKKKSELDLWCHVVCLVQSCVKLFLWIWVWNICLQGTICLFCNWEATSSYFMSAHHPAMLCTTAIYIKIT